jgi:hypothetical protein
MLNVESSMLEVQSLLNSVSQKQDATHPDSTKRAYTILLSAKKIKFFYSFLHNHLQILHPKKIPDFRIKRASLCFIWKAKATEQRPSRE